MKCLALLFVLIPSLLPATGELEELEKKLRNENDRTRQLAVASLAELDTEKAWSLVIGALDDETPQVADEAQLALGATANELVVAEILGKRGLKSNSETIQGRILEALGRSPVVIEPGVFVKPLANKSADIRFRAAWSLERLAKRDGLDEDKKGKLKKALEKAAAKDKSLDVRAEAYSALVELYPEEADARIELAIQSKHSEMIVAGLQAAARFETRKAAAIAARVSGSADVRVRRAAVELLAEIGSKQSLTMLVGRLESEQDMRLSWRIVEQLQSLSGRKHGRDPRPWRDWCDKQADDWTASRRSDAREYGKPSAAFVGMPVLSENVALLIDFSGSTWQEREAGMTRKEKLDVEVRRALESFPESTWFNVIPYATNPIPWEKELVPATKRNIKKALEFFEGCKTSGKGNFLDAALLALEDPRVDTLMVLTDGAPTGGIRWNLELLVPLLAEKGRYRMVAVDSLLVDASWKLKEFWADLAKRTGGRSIAVELK